jgi:hypothetical protein
LDSGFLVWVGVMRVALGWKGSKTIGAALFKKENEDSITRDCRKKIPILGLFKGI